MIENSAYAIVLGLKTICCTLGRLVKKQFFCKTDNFHEKWAFKFFFKKPAVWMHKKWLLNIFLLTKE